MPCQERFENASDVFRAEMSSGNFSIKVKILEKVRPRWWYFAFVSCEGLVPGELEYRIHARNWLRGAQSEFSMDEMGSLKLHLATFLCFLGLLCIVSSQAVRRYGSGALRSRPLLLVLLSSMGFSAAGGLCLLISSIRYMRTGVEFRAFDVLGVFLSCLAKVQLSLLQLFLVRGRDCLRSPGDFVRRNFVRCGIVVFVLVSVGCEIQSSYLGDLDYSTTLHFYSSWPGFVVLTLNTLLFLDVCRSSQKMLKQNNESQNVRNFFVRTTAAAMLYFAVLPVMTILAHAFAPWVRKKFVDRAEVFSRLLVCSLLSYCLWPSRLDVLINARLEAPEMREAAVELTEQFAFQEQWTRSEQRMEQPIDKNPKVIAEGPGSH